jgi:hypothetical protein
MGLHGTVVHHVAAVADVLLCLVAILVPGKSTAAGCWCGVTVAIPHSTLVIGGRATTTNLGSCHYNLLLLSAGGKKSERVIVRDQHATREYVLHAGHAGDDTTADEAARTHTGLPSQTQGANCADPLPLIWC